MSGSGMGYMNIRRKHRVSCARAAGDLSRSKISWPANWLLAALLATLATGLAAQETMPLDAADCAIEVTIEGIASTEGLIYASLFSSASGFPNERELAIANQSVPASDSSNGILVLKFGAIPAGTFALSIMHDANANGKLDTNFMGIPNEDYGFSQNPNSLFGPPSFDKAAVSLVAGETQQLTIKLK